MNVRLKLSFTLCYVILRINKWSRRFKFSLLQTLSYLSDLIQIKLCFHFSLFHYEIWTVFLSLTKCVCRQPTSFLRKGILKHTEYFNWVLKKYPTLFWMAYYIIVVTSLRACVFLLRRVTIYFMRCLARSCIRCFQLIFLISMQYTGNGTVFMRERERELTRKVLANQVHTEGGKTHENQLSCISWRARKIVYKCRHSRWILKDEKAGLQISFKNTKHLTNITTALGLLEVWWDWENLDEIVVHVKVSENEANETVAARWTYPWHNKQESRGNPN